jgi:hypothetical protein
MGMHYSHIAVRSDEIQFAESATAELPQVCVFFAAIALLAYAWANLHPHDGATAVAPPIEITGSITQPNCRVSEPIFQSL